MADDPSLAELQAQAEDRGLPKYGTKAELAERIAAYDDDDEGDFTHTQRHEHEHEHEHEVAEDGEREHPGTGEEMVAVDGDTLEAEPDAEPEPHRAGGYVDHDDGRGWTLEPEPEPSTGPPEPVEAGPGGLPGHPVMSAAGWSLPKDE